jgi:hypothetical protein
LLDDRLQRRGKVLNTHFEEVPRYVDMPT